MYLCSSTFPAVGAVSAAAKILSTIQPSILVFVNFLVERLVANILYRSDCERSCEVFFDFDAKIASRSDIRVGFVSSTFFGSSYLRIVIDG